MWHPLVSECRFSGKCKLLCDLVLSAFGDFAIDFGGRELILFYYNF